MRLLTVASTFLVAATITLAHAHGQYGGNYDHPYMWGGGWAGMIIGPIMMIVVIAAVVVAIVFLVRWLGGGSPRERGGGRSALDILEERFARGEIDKEEFEERRRALDQS